MSDGNDFKQRLERIQASKITADDPPIRSGGGSKKIVAGLVLVIGLVMLGFGGGSVLMATGKFEEWQTSFAASMESLTSIEMASMPNVHDLIVEQAFSSTENNAAETLAEAEAARKRTLIAPERVWPVAPAVPLTTDRMGSIYGKGFALTSSRAPIATDTILAGFKPSGPNSVLGEIKTFQPNETCSLRPVGRNEKLVNVNIGGSTAFGPIQRISKEGIHNTIRKATQEALEKGQSPGMIEVYRGRLGIVDLIITDTSGPLYLALQSSGRGVIWNIHAVPGVEIAHIAMISTGRSGVTGTFGDASFELLRPSRKLLRMNFYNFDGEPGDLECMSRPFREPDESWGAWAGAKNGNTLDGNLLFGRDKGFDSYDVWFKDTFGISAAENVISAASTDAVLIGAAPATPIAITTAPTPVHLPPDDLFLKGTDAQREAELIALYTDLVTAAAGGPHSEIMPETLVLSADLAPLAKVSGGTRSLGDHVYGKNDIESKVSLTKLSDARKVSFTVEVALEDLLQEGEALPPEEQRHSYAMMRAPRNVMQYCQDTLIEIATKCAIDAITILPLGKDRLQERGENIYQIRVDFSYVPNYAIGDVVRIDGGDFVSAFIPDQLAGRTHQTPEERRAFLASLKQICIGLRTAYTNCLIGTGGFYLNQPARFSNSDVISHAAGWVEVYHLDNPFEEKQFQERVDTLRPVMAFLDRIRGDAL